MRFGIVKLYNNQIGNGVILDSNGQEIEFKIAKNRNIIQKRDLVSFKICIHKSGLLVKNLHLISKYTDTRYHFEEVLTINLI